MADPWEQFADAPADDPWGQFQDAPAAAPVRTRKTSQTLGLMKGVARPLENLSRVNPLNMFDTERARATREEARKGMRNYFAEREQTERPGVVGEIAGNVLGTLPVALATRNPFIAGGAQGALLSEADSPLGVAGDAALGAGLNWAGGKVLDAAADAIKPAIDPAVQRLQAAGVKLTPGMVKGGRAMVKEDKMMSRPVVGDAIATGRQKTLETFNVAAVDEALKPLGVKVPKSVKAGNDAIDYAKREVSRAYDRIVPNLTVQINGQQFASTIAPRASSLPKAQQDQLRQIVSAQLGAGRLQGQPLKNAQGEIRRLASSYGRSQVAAERELGRALSAVDEELTRVMVAQNPKWAPELQKANEAYRGYRVVADAASRADEGVASTGQLRQAVRRGDFSKNKDATARGAAFMQDFARDARKVIPARTPDSGSAGRLQAGNLFAQVRGALDRAAYGVDEAVQNLRLAPRPAGARKAARTVRRLKPPAGAVAVAAGSQRRE